MNTAHTKPTPDELRVAAKSLRGQSQDKACFKVANWLDLKARARDEVSAAKALGMYVNQVRGAKS